LLVRWARRLHRIAQLRGETDLQEAGRLEVIYSRYESMGDDGCVPAALIDGAISAETEDGAKELINRFRRVKEGHARARFMEPQKMQLQKTPKHPR